MPIVWNKERQTWDNHPTKEAAYMATQGKQLRTAISTIEAEMYYALDTADRKHLERVQKNLTKLQKLGKDLDAKIQEDIKRQAEQINA